MNLAAFVEAWSLVADSFGDRALSWCSRHANQAGGCWELHHDPRATLHGQIDALIATLRGLGA